MRREVIARKDEKERKHRALIELDISLYCYLLLVKPSVSPRCLLVAWSI
jgi:hypothetical protein